MSGEPISYNMMEVRSPTGILNPVYDPAGFSGWKSVSDYLAAGESDFVTDRLGPGALTMIELAASPNSLYEISLSSFATLQPGDSWSIGNPITPGSHFIPIIDNQCQGAGKVYHLWAGQNVPLE